MKPYNLAISNSSLAEIARVAAHDDYKAKSNWKAARASKKIGKSSDITFDFFRYRGRHHGRTGSYAVPRYGSRLSVFDKFRAEYVCGFTDRGVIQKRKLRAPHGTEWDRDGSLVLSTDYSVEYHPTAEDFLARDFGRRVKAGLREAKNRREIARSYVRSQIAYDSIFNRESDSTIVTLHDSRRAGNCLEGSLRFAEQKLRVDRETVVRSGHLFGVPASRLRSLATGDLEAVERAIRVAYERETLVMI